MTAKELRSVFEDGFSDYEFSYKGRRGSVCPNTIAGLTAGYDGSEIQFNSFDELMDAPFLAGKSMNEVAEDIVLYG